MSRQLTSRPQLSYLNKTTINIHCNNTDVLRMIITQVISSSMRDLRFFSRNRPVVCRYVVSRKKERNLSYLGLVAFPAPNSAKQRNVFSHIS